LSIYIGRKKSNKSHVIQATALEDEQEEEVYSWEKEDERIAQATTAAGGTPTEDPTMHVAMASCNEIVNTTRGIEASDCINGSLVPKSSLTELTNFTYLLGLSAYTAIEKPLDKTGRVAPLESELIIANETKLQINLEKCVNSLRVSIIYFISVSYTVVVEAKRNNYRLLNIALTRHLTATTTLLF
jgi:hypothetical protein